MGDAENSFLGRRVGGYPGIAFEERDVVVLKGVVEGLFFKLGKNLAGPAQAILFGRMVFFDGGVGAQWKVASRGLMVLQGESDLLEIVGASGAAGGFASGLDGGQQQRDQDADDRDDDQELDERKAYFSRA